MRGASNPTVEQEVEGGIVLPRCRICNQVPLKGIHGGIRLKRAFICAQCEKELTYIDVGSANYQIILEKIKNILK
jgi:hypothetical protein